MTTFREALRQKDFVVTAEVPLRLTTTAADIRAAADALGARVDALQIAESRVAEGRMSGIAAASIAMSVGVDAVVHMTCRDRNRVALTADLLGAAAIGVTSLILSRGEKFDHDNPQRARGVFELNAGKLLALAKTIGEETALVTPPGYCAGTQVTAFRPDERWRAEGVQAKIDAGATFLQSQPCLNIDVVRAYTEKLVETRLLRRASLFIDVPLPTSVEDLTRVKALHPSAPIPSTVTERLAGAGDAAAEGVALCAETIRELRSVPGVGGVNIRYFGDPAGVVAVLDGSV